MNIRSISGALIFVTAFVIFQALLSPGSPNHVAARATTFGPDTSAAVPRQALLLEQEFNAEGYRRLGEAMALSDDTAFVGTLQSEVYVYSRTGNGWSRTQVIEHDSHFERFGSAVAIDGNTAVVGAPANTAWASQGSVYVYVRDGTGAWTESQRLFPSDGPQAYFGRKVWLAGDMLMALDGCRGVCVFRRVDGNWAETQGILSDPWDIALEPDTAVLGVPQQEVEGREYQGAVYVLAKATDGTWSQRHTLVAPNGQAHDLFGEYVALNGDYLLITAGRDATRASSVYVFRRAVDGTWGFEAEFKDPESTAADVNTRFGYGIAVNGDTALVGAPSHVVTDGRIGAAYLFRRDGTGAWRVQQRLIPPRMATLHTAAPGQVIFNTTGFGGSVALAGSAAIVGEPWANRETGALYFYRGYVSSPETIAVGVGASPASPMFSLHGDITAGFGNLGWGVVPWRRYMQDGGGMRPAIGDVDGDGLDEVVIGLEPVGYTNGWIAVLDDAAHHHGLLRWIQVQWPAYNAANGEVYPAVGDLDGDGRAEIVAGLGTGGRGYYEIFDDAQADFAHLAWGQVPWTPYINRDGSTHPAIGDVDGDGTKEIVLGLGGGANGWLQIVNGGGGGYTHRAWVQPPWVAYNRRQGTTFPAVGDVDGDGRDEIVVGLGFSGGGWIAVMDDANAGFAHLSWLQLQWPAYNQVYGESHPAVGNVDDDEPAEIVVGLATCRGEGGLVRGVRRQYCCLRASAVAAGRRRGLPDVRVRDIPCDRTSEATSHVPRRRPVTVLSELIRTLAPFRRARSVRVARFARSRRLVEWLRPRTANHEPRHCASRAICRPQDADVPLQFLKSTDGAVQRDVRNSRPHRRQRDAGREQILPDRVRFGASLRSCPISTSRLM